MPPFDFLEFARGVYAEREKAHREPFLLPALYGAEPAGCYDAVFVLEAPSVSFTEKRWRPCMTVEAAVHMHRQVFIERAYQGKPARLFRAVDGLTETADRSHTERLSGFFQRYYVTDIWKDAAFQGSDRPYREFWLSKLAVELNGVSAKRIIFVGRQAEKGKRLVTISVPVHHVPFPGQWKTDGEYDADVRQLVAEIQKVGS